MVSNLKQNHIYQDIYITNILVISRGFFLIWYRLAFCNSTLKKNKRFIDVFRYTSASEMISYNTGSGYPILNRRKTSVGDKIAGDLLDWSTTGPETSGSNRQYAIRATVKQGNKTVLGTCSLISRFIMSIVLWTV